MADFAKFNSIYNPTDTEKDNLLFGGTQAHKSKKLKKAIAKKKRNTKPTKIVHLNLHSKPNRHFATNHNASAMSARTSTNSHHSNQINHSKHNEFVSLAAIQAEQTDRSRKLSFKKRQQIHGCDGFAMSQSEHKHRIRHLDRLAFREKTVCEIYGGNSVFSCIPCSVEATNALLVDAALLQKALRHRRFDVGGGFKEAIIKQLQLQGESETVQVEVLPIFERAYISKPCVHLLIVQFQEHAHALSLYQHILRLKQSSNSNRARSEWEPLQLEFAAKWFAQCYFLQHLHVWSECALRSMVTVQHNNREHAQMASRTARHCRCRSHNKHDANCVRGCCCCTYWASEGVSVAHGNEVLWHGTRCTVDCRTPVVEDQQVRIQFEAVDGIEQQTKYVVALSSLQTTTTTERTEQTAMDDFAFVKYVKRFWNISEIERRAKLI